MLYELVLGTLWISVQLGAKEPKSHFDQVHSTGLCQLSAYIQFTLNVALE
jgi:hypothetical protein